MAAWIWFVLIGAGVLFALKITYVFSTALVLPATRGALYVATSGPRLDALLEAVPMRPGEKLVDLGCGDGRILSRYCKRYGAQVLGYELNPLAYLRARIRCLGLRAASVKMRNFLMEDLSGADVVFCYLFPDMMKLLAPKLRAELAPGTVIVSCNFELPGYSPARILRPAGCLHNDPIYIYCQQREQLGAEPRKKTATG